MLWFKTKEKAELDAAVRAAGKPATALVVEDSVSADHMFPATATHFGGNPYFERGDSWPILGPEKRPYDFVCQINLKECPDRPDVSFDLFTVFFCWALVEKVDIERACLVRTYRQPSPDRSVSIARPKALDAEDYQVTPCTVRAEPGFMTYPWSMDKYPGIVEAARRFKDPEQAYCDSLKRLGFWHEFRSRVGGFPTWVHDSTLEYDDLVHLAQIDYEPKANNCIQDAGPIFIAVSKSDPTRIETDAFQSF